MKISSDITIIKFIKDNNDVSSLSSLIDNDVIAICSQKQIDDLPASVTKITYSEEKGRVHSLNQAMDVVRTPWVLYMDEGEVICNFSFEPQAGNVYPAQIEHVHPNERTNYNYEIRLFPLSNGITFKGFDLPDLYDTFLQNEWKLTGNEFIEIQRAQCGEMYRDMNPDKEIKSNAESSKVRLIKAIRLVTQQDTKKAIKCFQQALKREKLFIYDYTAALNGLADALTEQNKWEDARTCVELSLLEESVQRMPYLVLYKIAHLNRNWSKAVENLEKYLYYHGEISRTNYDVYLKKEQCHYLIAESALRDGNYQAALSHYEQYYHLRGGDVEFDVLKKLLLYSIELDDYDHAVQHFTDMFDDYIPDLINEKVYHQIHEALSLFIEKGWADFSCKIYEQIYNENSKNETILHHWIAALIKAKKVKKAQRILAISQRQVS